MGHELQSTGKAQGFGQINVVSLLQNARARPFQVCINSIDLYSSASALPLIKKASRYDVDVLVYDEMLSSSML